MTAISGFWDILFPPVAIGVVLGLLCLKKFRQAEWFYPALFVTVVFAFAFLWRLLIIDSKRYALPLLVPGVLLAAVFFKFLHSQKRVPGRYLCGILMLAIIIAGIAKAMRFQEPKPYLREIPLTIKNDMETHGFAGQGSVIILGNVGGYLAFDGTIPVFPISGGMKFSATEERERLLKSLDGIDLHAILLQQPVTYIIVASDVEGSVVAESFSRRYQLPFELCYEFKRDKDGSRRQAFRVLSPYASSRLPVTVRNKIYKTANLLYNSDFQSHGIRQSDERCQTDTPVSQSDTAEKLSIPAGWNIRQTSRTMNLTPGMIECTASGRLRLQSTQILALYQSKNNYPGAKRYQIFAKARVPKTTYFFIDARQKSEAGFKQIQRVVSRTLAPGDHEIHAFLDLSSFPGEWVFEFGIVNGELEIETLSLVDEKVFRDNAPNNNF